MSAIAETNIRPHACGAICGAGGQIAAEITAKATADGYTILYSSDGPMAISSALRRKLPYDPLKKLRTGSIHSEIVKIMNDSGVKTNLANQGFEARTSTPEELATMIKSEAVKWARLVKESSAKVNTCSHESKWRRSQIGKIKSARNLQVRCNHD